MLSNSTCTATTRPPPYKEEKDDFSEPEWDKAERLWAQYKARTNSVMVDVFAGQLRSSVAGAVQLSNPVLTHSLESAWFQPLKPYT